MSYFLAVSGVSVANWPQGNPDSSGWLTISLRSGIYQWFAHKNYVKEFRQYFFIAAQIDKVA